MKIKSEKDLKLKEYIIRNLPLYTQSEEATCSAAISLIVLNYYLGNIFPLDKKTEMRIFKKIRFKKYDYGNFCKVACLFANCGLDTKIVVCGPNLEHPLFRKIVFKELLREYQLSLKRLLKENKVRFINKKFDIFDIMHDLSEGYLILVEIKYPDEELTHTLLLRGFRGRKIYYIDPLIKNGGRNCYYKELGNLINLETLKNYIAVRRFPKRERSKREVKRCRIRHSKGVF
ncbi:MAG: hypothetical protein NT076_04570 [Candidatus Pacearchaeota archaeon]|nr:hypothetical protein [Candidatus Pacearchaeota archaeon]